jgi:hypothetical protein
MRQWFETYSLQKLLAPYLAYSEEVASLGIGPADILGCFQVRTSWRSTGVAFSLIKYIVHRDYEDQLEANNLGAQLTKDLAPESSRIVDAPPFQNTKAYGSASGQQVFKSVQRTLPLLRGDNDRNQVRDYTVPELVAEAPPQPAPQRRRNSFDLGKSKLSSKEFP